MSEDRDERNDEGLSESERQHREDVQRACEFAQSNPHRVVTPQKLKEYRIRAWRHRYHPRHVASLIKLVYGTE